jgi:hypothetical protein
VEKSDYAKLWRRAATAPCDEEILLCHDNGKAGLFLGVGFRSPSEPELWFEHDAKTVMKLTPTHWMPVPDLPRVAEREAPTASP